MTEVRKSVEAEVAVKLADQRTEHERELSKLREEIVRLSAGQTRARKPAEPTSAVGRLTGRSKTSGGQ